jgi:hypothetical protein
MAHARIELGEGELSLVFGGLLLFAGLAFLGCHGGDVLSYLIHKLGMKPSFLRRASRRLARAADGASDHFINTSKLLK